MDASLLKGAAQFKRGYFRRKRNKFETLVRDGQNPSTLFITCADSRLLPHALTNADPGEMFVLRNVGNMVPPCRPGEECAAVGSAIEYAVGVLKVAHIVVCGHSHCGACAALYADEQNAELELTRRWLQQGSQVRDLVLAKAGADAHSVRTLFQSRQQRDQVLRATERAMVVQHLQNLAGYPLVADRVARGQLDLHGWYYQIESGEVEHYSAEHLAFLPLKPPVSRRLLRTA